jgi:general secretion pathway protein M
MRRLNFLVDAWRSLDSRSRLWSGYALISMLAVILGWSFLAAKTTELERKRAARENVLKELLPLKFAYRTARMSADQLSGRMAMLRPDDTPAKIIEEIGIRGKGVKITPLKGEERSGVMEDAADVRIEGLTANEMLNLIYRLEKGSRPITIKKSNMRVRFDDPARFDLAMTIALLKPLPSQAK